MKTAKRVIEWLGTAIVGIAVLLVAFMLVGPRFGWDTHPILSGSMEPALGVGGAVVTRPVRLSDVRVGDIITFKPGDELVTHRVADIIYKQPGGKPWFKTKGDANRDPDANLVSSDGEWMAVTVLYVPYLGYLANIVKSKLAFLVLIGLPALFLIGLFSREIWRGILQEKANRGQGCTRSGA